MRNRVNSEGLEVSVVAGNYAAFLSIVITDNGKVDKPDFLDFQMTRVDKTEDEHYALKGFKRFAETAKDATGGQLFDTDKQPIQSFFWEDFTIKPDHEYTYEITPVYGKPKHLLLGTTVSLNISSEPTHGEKHSAYFNRGVAGSLAYAREFGNRKPEDMTDEERAKARIWLSRGLEEALLGFINLAIEKKYGIRAAFYEFTYQPVLEKLKEAVNAGCDVQIIYDSRDEEAENDASIKVARLAARNVTPRKNDPQVPSHNKFMLLLDNGNPIKVWTGSVNITDKGILGHSNVGHIINDEEVAGQYLEYWKELHTDPDLAAFRDKTEAIQNDIPGIDGFDKDTTVFFSPRKKKTILKTYAAFIERAEDLICGIFPFSFNKDMKTSLALKTDHLKYILVDKVANASGITREDKFTFTVNGAYFAKEIYDWMSEVNAGVLLNKNHNPFIGTNYVHNKVLLIDPLGKKPVIIVGSANFSDPSIASNDENTLVIKGGPDIRRIADIYFTEFYRLFHHFFVRMATESMSKKQDTSPGSAANPLLLKTTNEWVANFNRDASKLKLQELLRKMEL